MTAAKEVISQNTNYIRFLVINLPNPETASKLMTSNFFIFYNQPVPETNKQYRRHCNREIFIMCDKIINTIIVHTVMFLCYLEKEQKEIN